VLGITRVCVLALSASRIVDRKECTSWVGGAWYGFGAGRVGRAGLLSGGFLSMDPEAEQVGSRRTQCIMRPTLLLLCMPPSNTL
jgi:hypothetical protein